MMKRRKGDGGEEQRINQIQSLETEVIKSEEMIADMKSQSDNLMFKAESQSNMLLVVQSCALKRRSVAEQEHVREIKRRIVELTDMKKTMS